MKGLNNGDVMQRALMHIHLCPDSQSPLSVAAVGRSFIRWTAKRGFEQVKSSALMFQHLSVMTFPNKLFLGPFCLEQQLTFIHPIRSILPELISGNDGLCSKDRHRIYSIFF